MPSIATPTHWEFSMSILKNNVWVSLLRASIFGIWTLSVPKRAWSNSIEIETTNQASFHLTKEWKNETVSKTSKTIRLDQISKSSTGSPIIVNADNIDTKIDKPAVIGFISSLLRRLLNRLNYFSTRYDNVKVCQIFQI